MCCYVWIHVILLTKGIYHLCRIVFSSDSEEEKTEVNPTKRKKKSKTSGWGALPSKLIERGFFLGQQYLLFSWLVIWRVEPVILKDMGPSQCLQNSLEFLKNRKMQVPRSSAVLNNSSQALRLLSSSGLICKKWELGCQCVILMLYGWYSYVYLFLRTVHCSEEQFKPQFWCKFQFCVSNQSHCLT